jgi:hypothetical protein
LFVQLIRCITAVAEAPYQHNVSQKQHAAVAAFSYHHDPAAELARSIHFTGTTFQVKDHRFQEDVLAANNLNSSMATALRKRAIAYSASPRSPLIRLLLFPNHYFW